MRRYAMLRNFESTLRHLSERGHDVHLAFESVKSSEPVPEDILERLEAQPTFSWGHLPKRRDAAWAVLADEARAGTNYLRYLEPEYADADALSSRARSRAPRTVVALAERRPGWRRPIKRALDLALAAQPADPAAVEYLRERSPDLVVTTSLVRFRSAEPDYVVAARILGIPTAYCVHSWDNLTNKGMVHGRPDRVLVWNEAQRREAADLHGVPEERVLATGSQSYDHWFDWRPSGSREAFCARVGLRADRPFLLYLCSSRKIARHEVPFVERWVAALRSADDPALQELGVLVRPHPYHVDQWEGYDLSAFGEAVVWPREHIEPTDRSSASDFFDSMYHSAAIVGVNTSALIESAIVGRPVLSLLSEDFEQAQEGTLHFDHLRPENGGPLTIAADLDEHRGQLAVALDPAGGAAERIRSFVSSFVRPRGLDVEATGVVVDELERVAGERAPAPAPRRALTLALTPVAHLVRTVRDRRAGRHQGLLHPKTRRRAVKALRRGVGRLSAARGAR